MKQKTSEAKKTLETWKESYFDVRAKIEASGRDARWEFDRKRLFERTDHMASICEDLKEVATVMEEFYNIFGPELKAVTGDPKRIEDVLKRVDGLVKPIENVGCKLKYMKAHLYSVWDENSAYIAVNFLPCKVFSLVTPMQKHLRCGFVISEIFSIC